MKKSTIVIINVLCTLVVCIGAFLVTDYFAKRDGRTKESRELIVREELGADFVICEEKINGIIYVAFEFPNRRIGVTGFEQKGDKYKTSGLHSKYSNADVPNVIDEIIDGRRCDIIFFNKPDLDYVELTYEVIDYEGEEIEVTKYIEYEKEKQILRAERPQVSEPASITFYDKSGRKYEFVDESEYPNGCYIKK